MQSAELVRNGVAIFSIRALVRYRMLRSATKMTIRFVLGLILVSGLSSPWAGIVSSAVAVEHEGGSETPGAVHGETHHEGGHGGGHAKPNPLTLQPDLAVFTAIVFLLLVAILGKFAWKPIIEAVDRREHAVAAEINAAQDANQQARRLLAEHEARLASAAEDVRRMLDQAQRDAEQQKQQILAEAQRAATAERDRALRAIDAAKDGALRDLAKTSVNTAMELAGKIVQRQLKPDDHAQLIGEALDRFPAARG